MKLNITKIGSGKPQIAIVGCLHGDEIIGKKAIDELKKIKLLRGSLKLVVANEKALRAKKRMVEKDLNRSFPGKKNGCYEEKLAHCLIKEILPADVVIDVHATNSNFERLAITSKLDKKTKQILKHLPCDKVALISSEAFGENSMIRFAKVGIAIEYGPNKKGGNYGKALDDILILLKNLEMIEGIKKNYSRKELYEVEGKYAVDSNFKASKKIKNFKLIKKGETIGQTGTRKIRSTKSFYPLFLGEKSYKNTLAIMAGKKEIILK